MINRLLLGSLKETLKKARSILLLGPRQVGKSTLIKKLKVDLEFNLSNQKTFLEFAKNPSYLEEVLTAKNINKGVVFIDEVQRIPSLLNTIQYLIDKNKKTQFILTGSSARKLKRGKANLLPGRVHSYELGPIVSSELNYKMEEKKALSFGTLPSVTTENDVLANKKLLKAYTQIYLHEEIKAEALSKNIEGFTRFLFALAGNFTHFLDLSKVSNQAAVPRQTVQRYFEILEDTLIIKRLDSFAKGVKRRIIQHPKFFIFDNGVLNSLLNNFQLSSDRIGPLFENLFFNQLNNSLSYSNYDYRLSSYRTSAGAEIDIILELDNQTFALELKSGYFNKSSLGGFRSFEEFYGKKVLKKIITLDGSHRMIDKDIEVIPRQSFLKNLGI